MLIAFFLFSNSGHASSSNTNPPEKKKRKISEAQIRKNINNLLPDMGMYSLNDTTLPVKRKRVPILSCDMLDENRKTFATHYQEYLSLKCFCYQMNCFITMGYNTYTQETMKMKNLGKEKNKYKKQKLRELFTNNLISPKIGQPPLLHFTVNGSLVCKGAWTHVYGISNYLYNKMEDAVLWGVSDIHGNFGIIRANSKKEESIAYIKTEVDLIGETYTDGTIHIPCCYNKAKFLSMVKTKYPNVEFCKRATLYKLFKNELSMVKFPKKTRLGRCDECIKLSQLRSKATTLNLKNIFREKRKEHMLLVWAERATYTTRRVEAVTFPEDVLSIAIDKSSPIPFPLIVPYSKSSSKTKFKLSVFGGISHGNNTRTCIILPPIYRDDPNMAISVLWTFIRDTLKSSVHRPSKLYVQMDNCAKENKNRWLIAFCALLLKLRIFVNVCLSFLPPAHGHNDVDQMFSYFSPNWKLETVLSFEALEARLKECYTAKFIKKLRKKSKKTHLFLPSSAPPTFSWVDKIWNWKEYLGPSMVDFSGHSVAYQFHFSTNNQNIVECTPQSLCSDASSLAEPFQPLSQIPPGSPYTLGPIKISKEVYDSVKPMYPMMSLDEQKTFELFVTNNNLLVDSFIPMEDEKVFDVVKLHPIRMVPLNSQHHMHDPATVTQGDLNINPRRFPIRVGDVVAIKPEQGNRPNDPFWLGIVKTVPFQGGTKNYTVNYLILNRYVKNSYSNYILHNKSATKTNINAIIDLPISAPLLNDIYTLTHQMQNLIFMSMNDNF